MVNFGGVKTMLPLRNGLNYGTSVAMLTLVCKMRKLPNWL